LRKGGHGQKIAKNFYHGSGLYTKREGLIRPGNGDGVLRRGKLRARAEGEKGAQDSGFDFRTRLRWKAICSKKKLRLEPYSASEKDVKYLCGKNRCWEKEDSKQKMHAGDRRRGERFWHRIREYMEKEPPDEWGGGSGHRLRVYNSLAQMLGKKKILEHEERKLPAEDAYRRRKLLPHGTSVHVRGEAASLVNAEKFRGKLGPEKRLLNRQRIVKKKREGVPPDAARKEGQQPPLRGKIGQFIYTSRPPPKNTPPPQKGKGSCTTP